MIPACQRHLAIIEFCSLAARGGTILVDSAHPTDLCIAEGPAASDRRPALFLWQFVH